jgi:PAS domain S-box-containing protein
MNRPTMSVMLVLSASENTAQALESHLRNQGHAVRVGWVADLEELEDALRRQPPQVLLTEHPLPEIEPSAVVALRDGLSPQLPLLLLRPELDLQGMLDALALGAEDAVSMASPAALQYLERRCLAAFLKRRQTDELSQLRQRLQRFEKRHLQLVAEAPDAIARFQEGIFVDGNQAFAQLLGQASIDALIGVPLMDLVAADDMAAVKAQMKRLNKPRDRWEEGDLRLDCGFTHADGHRVPIQAELSVGEEEGERSLDLLIRAPTVAAGGAEALTTGPVGRLALRLALDSHPPETHRRALLNVVIDGFPGLEQRLGYLGVEEALNSVDAWLEGLLDGDDQVFRTGSHEWVLLLLNRESRQVQSLAKAICEGAQKTTFATRDDEVTLSMSVVGYPMAENEAADTVLGTIAAEARAHAAKAGRKYLVLGPVASASERLKVLEGQAANLREAIDNDRLRLAFQSIASLEGDAVHHYEVLVRMVGREGREVHASEFIEAAREFNLMMSIDRWVVEHALAMQRKRGGTDGPPGLFIKLSEQTLRELDDFLPWLEPQLAGRSLAPHELVFEITENAAQANLRKAKQLAEAAAAMGAEVAVEHFGLGSHSVQLVQHLPLQFLKFSPLFTQEYNNKERQVRLSELVEVARQRQVKTIVSHVENAQAMARLWQLGVNYIQGFSVQEPEVVMLAADARQ